MKIQLKDFASKEFQFLLSKSGKWHIVYKHLNDQAVCGTSFDCGVRNIHQCPPILDLCRKCATHEGSLFRREPNSIVVYKIEEWLTKNEVFKIQVSTAGKPTFLTGVCKIIGDLGLWEQRDRETLEWYSGIYGVIYKPLDHEAFLTVHFVRVLKNEIDHPVWKSLTRRAPS